METIPLIGYLGPKHLLKLLEKEEDFILLYPLNAQNRKALFSVHSRLLDHPHCRGIVFEIGKNDLLLLRLFFLKELIESWTNRGKKVGFGGIPACVRIEILQPWLFSRLKHQMIPEKTERWERIVHRDLENSALLLSCRDCLESSDCTGLGTNPENLRHAWTYRNPPEIYAKNRDLFFHSRDPELHRKYRRFARHADTSDLHHADRYLYFSKPLDKHSDYAFTDRFIYHCDYLPPEEYTEEIDFLADEVEHKEILETYAALGRRGRISRFGYSYAFRGSRRRESFYFAPSHPDDPLLLKYFDLDPALIEKRTFIGLGIDFYPRGERNFKIYTEHRVEELQRNFVSLLTLIDIDLYALRQKSHFHVRRMDAQGRLLTQRIDLTYRPEDHTHFLPYLRRFPFSEEEWNAMHILGIAFDFRENALSKITLYYRNRF